ncbi:hypothetical protein LIER_05858 [Lithospermum erythrorhizon]|uniref:Uncharacterized protein n=1 Tax=Lithospermum erythrorhizon TaxID=34254 RepID=A0AAV3P3D3_LITER
MHQRGRPSGTDGSDFSYRMVVDNRYTKVAQGKSQLSKLIFAQAICQLLVATIIALSTMPLKDDRLYQLGIFSVMLGFISLIIGELGRNRSKVNFLKLFLVGSSISSVLSYGLIIHHLRLLEALKDLSNLVNSKVELFGIVAILLDLPIHVKTVTTTILLIGNMKPPKKAS